MTNKPNNRQLTSIQLTKEFVEYLKSLGKKGQSYEDIIKECIGQRVSQ